MESEDTTDQLDDKICEVCGDKALGFNFSAVTCEPCKAFFRRNAIQKKDHKCAFDNQCKINVLTRRFCPKCRLDKCFDVGMKKEFIMTDGRKRLKKEKLSGKRQSEDMCSVTKFANLGDTKNVGQHINCTQLLQSQYNRIQFESDKPRARVLAMPQENFAMREISSNTDKSTQTFGSDFCANKVMFGVRNSQFSRTASTKQSKDCLSEESRNSEMARSEHATLNGCRCKPQVVDRSWIYDTVADIANVAISAEYSSLASHTGIQVVGSRVLSSIEIEKLNELLIANAEMQFHDEDDEYFCNLATNPRLLDVINMTDYSIRKIIKMSKKITAFKNLCQEDQIALLKGSCIELMIIRSVMTYDPEKDCWPGPNMTYVKVDVLKEAKGNVYEDHKRFIHSFDPKWRNDENLMLILLAIVLFRPTHPNIVHAEVIEMEQGSYYFLLQRYLESIYIGCEAKANFLKLVRIVQDLKKLNENHVQMFLDLNPKEPLLIEMFDLTI